MINLNTISLAVVDDNEPLVRTVLWRVEGGQSAIANDDDPACLVVAAPSATLGTRPLVPRARRAQWWPPTQDDDCGACPQIAGRAVEICERRRRDRRCRCEQRRRESRLTIPIESIP